MGEGSGILAVFKGAEDGSCLRDLEIKVKIMFEKNKRIVGLLSNYKHLK